MPVYYASILLGHFCCLRVIIRVGLASCLITRALSLDAKIETSLQHATVRILRESQLTIVRLDAL